MNHIKLVNRSITIALLISLCRIYSYSQEPEKILSRFNFSISLPMVHNNILSMPDTVLNNTSFLGLTIGIGYYHNDKNFINLIFGATISNENPIPVGIDYVELHEQYNTLFIGLSTNHRISLFLKNKLSYSLGLNYIDYKVLNYRDAYDTSYYTINKSTLGLSIGLEYQIIRYFSVGMKLKSSLYNFSSNTFEYNHIAYLDFIFRLGAKREQ